VTRFGSDEGLSWDEELPNNIQQAIKYNKGQIVKIHSALIFPDKKPIFRDGIEPWFQRRLKAKAEDNDALSEALKLLMNSWYGKFEEKIHDSKFFVSGDNDKIDHYYQ